jgi:hypothetical protein
MELTNTLVIKFALGIQNILALLFILLNKIRLVLQSNLYSTFNVFQKKQYYVSFSFSNPDKWLVNETYCCV